MQLLAFAGCLALLWLLHTAMLRIERMRPPKQDRRTQAKAKPKAPPKPDR